MRLFLRTLNLYWGPPSAARTSSVLPLAVLGVSSSSTPFTGWGCGSSVCPLVSLAVPAASLGSGEASGSSLPVSATGSEGTGLNGGGANLLNTGQLLLLDLLLGLSLRVAVCR